MKLMVTAVLVASAVIATVLLAGCADKDEVQRLFKECVEQAKSDQPKGFKLLDTSEDIVRACEGYARRNA